jgi:hypothetical protein
MKLWDEVVGLIVFNSCGINLWDQLLWGISLGISVHWVSLPIPLTCTSSTGTTGGQTAQRMVMPAVGQTDGAGMRSNRGHLDAYHCGLSSPLAAPGVATCAAMSRQG